MRERFIEALETGNLEAVRNVPKGDLHNHATRGGNIRTLEEWLEVRIERPKGEFTDLAHMQGWMRDHILPILHGVEGYEIRTKAAFAQAKADGVKLLKMSIDVSTLNLYNHSMDHLIRSLEGIQREFAPDIVFWPEIGLDKGQPIKELSKLVEPFLACDYFRAIDIYGNEDAQPFSNFKAIYRKAGAKGLLLNAHAGEFGDAASIWHAVEELELHQIQHGINAVTSTAVMRKLADHNIQLNICPTSNVSLGRVADYNVHPIRQLYDNGIKVTVNTDDVLIFDQGVSEEYLHLYRAGLFNAKEMNEIRENSLS